MADEPASKWPEGKKRILVFKDITAVYNILYEPKYREYAWTLGYVLAVTLLAVSALILGAGKAPTALSNWKVLVDVFWSWRASLLYAYLVAISSVFLIYVSVYKVRPVTSARPSSAEAGNRVSAQQEIHELHGKQRRLVFCVVLGLSLFIAFSLARRAYLECATSNTPFWPLFSVLAVSLVAWLVYALIIWRKRNNKTRFLVRWQFVPPLMLFGAVTFFLGSLCGSQLGPEHATQSAWILAGLIVWCFGVLLGVKQYVVCTVLLLTPVLIIAGFAVAEVPESLAGFAVAEVPGSLRLLFLSILVGFWLASLETWRYIPEIISPRKPDDRKTFTPPGVKPERQYRTSVVGMGVVLLLFPLTFFVHRGLGIFCFTATGLMGVFGIQLWILRGYIWPAARWRKMKILLGCLLPVMIILDVLVSDRFQDAKVAKLLSNVVEDAVVLAGIGPIGLLTLVFMIRRLFIMLGVGGRYNQTMSRLSILAMFACVVMLVWMPLLTIEESAWKIWNIRMVAIFAAYPYWLLIALSCICVLGCKVFTLDPPSLNRENRYEEAQP